MFKLLNKTRPQKKAHVTMEMETRRNGPQTKLPERSKWNETPLTLWQPQRQQQKHVHDGHGRWMMAPLTVVELEQSDPDEKDASRFDQRNSP
jgi:hypothetical protein